MPVDLPADCAHALLITGARSWTDEQTMRQTFRRTWERWATETPASQIRAVLISGHCPKGADAMAERLWRSAGFSVLEYPADWSSHGRAAGMIRNGKMVDLAVQLRDKHSIAVAGAAFLDRCMSPHCRDRSEQLAPGARGHLSHGTVHCRSLIVSAQIPLIDAVQLRS